MAEGNVEGIVYVGVSYEYLDIVVVHGEQPRMIPHICCLSKRQRYIMHKIWSKSLVTFS